MFISCKNEINIFKSKVRNFIDFYRGGGEDIPGEGRERLLLSISRLKI